MQLMPGASESFTANLDQALYAADVYGYVSAKEEVMQLSFLEAIQFAVSRKIVLPDEFYKLDLNTRQMATTVSFLFLVLSKSRLSLSL
jgi:hypothetical protein